jgi:hypothetical protein
MRLGVVLSLFVSLPLLHLPRPLHCIHHLVSGDGDRQWRLDLHPGVHHHHQLRGRTTWRQQYRHVDRGEQCERLSGGNHDKQWRSGLHLYAHCSRHDPCSSSDRVSRPGLLWHSVRELGMCEPGCAVCVRQFLAFALWFLSIKGFGLVVLFVYCSGSVGLRAWDPHVHPGNECHWGLVVCRVCHYHGMC